MRIQVQELFHEVADMSVEARARFFATVADDLAGNGEAFEPEAVAIGLGFVEVDVLFE